MRVRHDNFGSIPVNAQKLALAVRNDEQLSNLWSFVTIAQGSLLSNFRKSYFHRRKKVEVDPRTLHN